MDMGLAGKTVVVTGATANIGRAIALAFAAEGATVAVVGRDEAQGRRVVALAVERGAAAASWHRADVREEMAVRAMVADVQGMHGPIDVLVNNVGGNVDVRPFADSTPDQWRADIDLTLITTMLCTHAVLPAMVERGDGCIINIGSMSAIVGDKLMAAYSAAKGAIHSFTKVLASELGPSGIRVNCVAPYATFPQSPDETSSGSRFQPDNGLFMVLRRERPADLAKIPHPTALNRKHARPEEIGSAAVYLASRHAEFITGEILAIDGGMRVA